MSKLLSNTAKLISEIPEELRPYEKCEAFGAQYLTDAELLAVIIKSGTRQKSSVLLAEELLYPDGIRMGFHALIQSSLEELQAVKGIGRVKAIQLACLGEICRRMSEESISVRTEITDPSIVADYYMQRFKSLTEEEVHLMVLDSRDRLIRSSMISKGTVNCSAVSPREIFISALSQRAAGIIMVHNHPSGDPTPSEEDVAFSKLLYTLGELMNIPLRDSIIIGDNCFYSLLEKGLIT